MNRFEDILKDKYPQKWWVAIFSSFGALLLLLISQLIIVAILGYLLKIPLELPSKNQTFEGEMKFATLLIGLGFLVPSLVLIAYRKHVQKLPIYSLIGVSKFRPKLLIMGAVAAFLTIGIDLLLMFVLENYFGISSKSPEPVDRIAKYGLSNFALLAAIYAVVIIIQAGFEELFFRGFLMQHIRRIGLNMIWATAITSLIFCAGHINKGVPFSALFMILMMGLAFQIGTNICQGIEAAMGAHIVNNFLILGVIGVMDNSGGEDPIGYVSGTIYFIVFLGAVLLAKRLWPEDFLARSE